MNKFNQLFEKRAYIGELFIRFIIGFHLIYGTQDNIFSWDRMLEFSEFLTSFGFPIPLVSAVVSVYAQFLCGILFMVGYKVRIAAAIMIVNFIIALTMVHIGDSYPQMFPALVMLFGSFYLLFNGSNAINMETLCKKRIEKGRTAS